MNVAHLLLQQAERRPDAPALIETHEGRDHIVTFAELESMTARAAALLQTSGLHAGDTALVFQPMSIDLYVALIALLRVGVTAMFLDPSAGRAHIERCCALAPPSAFLGSPKAHLLRLFSRALRRIPHLFVFGFPLPGATSWRRADASPIQKEICSCLPETPALLTFTSGSTGQPKGAVRSHGFLTAQHRALEATLELRPGEIDLTTLPIFVLANLASGLTSLIPDADLRRPGHIAPKPVLAQIHRHCPTRAGASPALLLRLADAAEPLPELQTIYTGGAPVFPNHLDRMSHVAPHAEVVAVYGSTEAEPIAHIGRSEISEEDRSRMQSGGGLLTGRPVDCIALRILTDRWGEPRGHCTTAAFNSETQSPETPGEIVVSGAHVLPGYLMGEGDAETKFRVEGTLWHRTGDAGYLDSQGRLWLLGRCSAKIEDSYGILYPFAVECAAQQQPGVRRAALMAHRGRRLLIVEPEDGGPSPDMDALWLTLNWAMPDRILVWKHIPVDRRHNAKIDYLALRTRLQRRY